MVIILYQIVSVIFLADKIPCVGWLCLFFFWDPADLKLISPGGARGIYDNVLPPQPHTLFGLENI